jgi:hypothetical protein
MAFIPAQLLRQYRDRSFRASPGYRIHTRDEAVQFVDQRGFIYFWPIKDIVMPSLWVAVAGDRPVADAHNDPGHITWGWKDELLGARVWYYAKALRKKSTLICLEAAPFFYALSENYGSPEQDHLIQYEAGRMTQEAKQVYEALLFEGALDTVSLRRAARLTSPESDSRFNRALTDLQADFKILPIGVAQAGAWRYAFIYEIVPRHYPELVEKARFITEGQARRKLIHLYLCSVGACQNSDLTKIFGWNRSQVADATNELIQSGKLTGGLQVEDQPGDWYCAAELIGIS